MPDDSASTQPVEPQATSITTTNGSVKIVAEQATIGGDVVGRDKITVGYTVEQVSTLLTQISSTFQPKPFDGSCPYLGLDFFTEDDAGRFFGRERLVTDLLERVKTSRFVIIAGPSGSGKSSLVRAGLLHALKQGALSDSHSDRWLYTTLTPGHDPIEQLALAMSRLAKSPDAARYMREHSAEAGALHECAESQLSDRKDQRAVIFVDQFEEVFTQVAKDSDRVAFLNLLTTAATIENGRVTVLFALRSDFVTNCATYPQLNTLVNQQFLLVGAMQPDELVSAIARPALEVGLRIDPDLIAQIVNDMQDEPGVLPLMQFALEDLFNAQQAKGGVIALTLTDYLARGGLRKALERHADKAFAKLSANEQQLARSIFAGLIEVGSGHEDTRRTASFAELVPASTAADPVKAVIRKLADARLITTAEQDRKESVTISHERLIDAWPWLRKLIDGNREAIALQNEIARDGQDWDRNQRDASYLYVGARLANAREKLAAKEIVLSGTAQAFVEAGMAAVEEARQREEARRQKELDNAKRIAASQRRAATLLRWVVIVLALGIIGSLIGGVIAMQQRNEAQHQARIAFSRQLASQALTHLDDHFDLALLLATAASQVENTTEARSNLLSALQLRPLLETFIHGHTKAVTNVAFSPDGRILASGSDDKTIILWEVTNPRAPAQLSTVLPGYKDGVYGVAFSSDGKTLASAGCGKPVSQLGCIQSEIILWNVTDPNMPTQLGYISTGDTSDVQSVAFSPDGKTLALAGCGRSGLQLDCQAEIILWDVTNPRTPAQLGSPLIGHKNFVSSVTFSPGGKTLASSSADKTMLWDVTDPRMPTPLGTLPGGNTWAPSSVAFSPDGRTLASASCGKSQQGNCTQSEIILWDVTNPHAPTPLGAPLVSHTNYVRSVAFSPNGKILASGSDDKTIILWDVTDLRAPTPLGIQPLTGHTNVVSSVAFSPDGKTLASGSWDKTIILWDGMDPGVPTPLGTPLVGHASNVGAVAFSPDGRTLASASCGKSQQFNCSHGEITLWNVTNPQAPTRLGDPLTGPANDVSSVAFSPDGRTLASGSDDNTIILWDVTNPHAPTRLGAPLISYTDGVNSIVLSPDNKTLASGSNDSKIILWDVTDPRAPTRLGAPFIVYTFTGSLNSIVYTSSLNSIAFSPDSKILASATGNSSEALGNSDDAIILWDVTNPHTPTQLGLRPLTDHTDAVTSVAFSPDGKTLASGSWDETIILWDVTNPRAPTSLGAPLTGHTSPVFAVAFSPDGKTLASGGLDKAIILWDVTNPRAPTPLGALPSGYNDIVYSIAFSPDGKTLASSTDGKTVLLWDLDLKSWQARACQMAGRNFTRAEWTKYYGAEPYRKTCDQWPFEPEITATPTPAPTVAPTSIP